jgi:hypothetical protein
MVTTTRLVKQRARRVFGLALNAQLCTSVRIAFQIHT